MKKIKAVLLTDTWEGFINIATAFWKDGKALSKFAVINGNVETKNNIISFFEQTNAESIIFFGYNNQTLVYCKVPLTPEMLAKVENRVKAAEFRL